MTAPEDLPAGVCVCGREIPETSPSDWACGEPCQSAWLMHQANPNYPSPKEIREAAEQRAARPRIPQEGLAPSRAALAREAHTVAEGTEIETEGQGYARIGGRWQAVGPWRELERTDLAAVVRYRRWCPQCARREPPELHTSATPGAPDGFQVCPQCRHTWAGRPLIGVVETRGEPWPGIRVRLTDGHRSTTAALTDDMLTRAGNEVLTMIDRIWLKLERQLGNGLADQDEANPQRQRLAVRRRGRLWDDHAYHLHVHMGRDA